MEYVEYYFKDADGKEQVRKYEVRNSQTRRRAHACSEYRRRRTRIYNKSHLAYNALI